MKRNKLFAICLTAMLIMAGGCTNSKNQEDVVSKVQLSDVPQKSEVSETSKTSFQEETIVIKPKFESSLTSKTESNIDESSIEISEDVSETEESVNESAEVSIEEPTHTDVSMEYVEENILTVEHIVEETSFEEESEMPTFEESEISTEKSEQEHIEQPSERSVESSIEEQSIEETSSEETESSVESESENSELQIEPEESKPEESQSEVSETSNSEIEVWAVTNRYCKTYDGYKLEPTTYLKVVENKDSFVIVQWYDGFTSIDKEYVIICDIPVEYIPMVLQRKTAGVITP